MSGFWQKIDHRFFFLCVFFSSLGAQHGSTVLGHPGTSASGLFKAYLTAISQWAEHI